ncbi:Root phototropism protein 3 [Acorus calamus]|uniref:Root phototropism protein 3 n=1 Tax=Acorus calamus TaxID=4465 RepID=A0AAV9BYT6_ACOCL|nr:Root phototropism protein 3 [Acorus calamus]
MTPPTPPNPNPTSVETDIDRFIETLSAARSKGLRPDLIGSMIAHYASKWLSDDDNPHPSNETSPKSAIAAYVKRRTLIETITGLLPPESDAMPCNFVLRLLRAACMAGADPACLARLERRASAQLDRASLKELMIPAFSHTCGTLLDVALVTRLVRGFVESEEIYKSGAAAVKVSKLVDSYLAEAAVDAGMTVAEFEALATALPGHARATDDGLYRAVDMYLKAHPSTSKQDKKTLCRLIDSRKLSTDASIHAAQNDRLPVRAVVQVLFSEHSKLNTRSSAATLDWTASFTGARSPGGAANAAAGFDLPARCPSKRDVMAQQSELRRLRDDVIRLQNQCHLLQAQMDGLREKRKSKKGFLFGWRLFGGLFLRREKGEEEEAAVEVSVAGSEKQTPVDPKKVRLLQNGTPPPKWRNSTS